LDIDIERAKKLIGQREAIDAELASLFAGSTGRKPQKCGKCGAEGHSARTCPVEQPVEQ
jgi:hypothetical protein